MPSASTARPASEDVIVSSCAMSMIADIALLPCQAKDQMNGVT
jgi:hypothetical protein